MKGGGILGFHCAYQYPEGIEGTYFYERYPRTLKGIDAVLFTVFRALGLTVHIKPYEGRRVGGESMDATTRFRDLISIQEDTDRQPEVKEVWSLNLDDDSIGTHGTVFTFQSRFLFRRRNFQVV